MTIAPEDLTGVARPLATRLLAYARTIAPCLQSLEEVDRETAIALLVGVAGDARARGSLFVKSQRTGGSAVEYTPAESWFMADDREALRALCSTSAPAGGPAGHFPRAGHVGRLWPELYDE